MDTHSIGGIIKILSETIGREANANCKEFNLTMQQMKVLHFIKTQGGNGICSQKDIQDYMRISHPTTVNILRLLKEKGFVEISVDEKDKRMRTVTLTGQEKGFFRKLSEGRNNMEKRLVRGMSEEEQENLRRYLEQMYYNITESQKESEGEVHGQAII